MGVTATGRSLDEAVAQAYAAVSTIHFPGMHYRKDIGETANTMSRNLPKERAPTPQPEYRSMREIAVSI
jgi:hypothetical protein